ncbi:hypothetical protein ACI2K4_20715 [Micromonospora sp. NPDC050397]|uniref:hypothetical protein n=1 Tax=Micromonospora sp. NPDC050397 TaxID=3364279 RepID=UPI00384B21CF
MTDPDQHPLTIMPRSVWPAILGGARATVEAHEGGECQMCPAYAPGQCTRLLAAQQAVVDPLLLHAEQESVERKARR